MIEAEPRNARADRHSAEAQAVVDFLIKELLLAAPGQYARPGHHRGRGSRRAGRAIEGRFADQPLVEASIQHQIALALVALGGAARLCRTPTRPRGYGPSISAPIIR